MKTLPHLDIVSGQRIDKILADPTNFFWPATSSEDLDGWVPDFGLTYYDRPSIYRPASVAENGISSSLSHRFWRTVEGKSDLTGQRYIGVVLYAAVGEPCPLEFHLRSDGIGRIEPTRLDNRRHLIVVDHPVEFIGAMEVFRMIAPGPGTYRIETIVLLQERPQPTLFTPHIQHLSCRMLPACETGENGINRTEISAELHFMTTEMARCRVQISEEDTASKNNYASATNQTLTKRHVINLPNLIAGQRYCIDVTATERDGQSVTETLHVETPLERLESTQQLSIPIELINLTTKEPDINMQNMPVTFGVPLPQGAINSPSECLLQHGNQGVTAQVRIHSRWPDGSARWALIDAPLPSPLRAGESDYAQVIFGVKTDAVFDAMTSKETESTFIITTPHLRATMKRNQGDVWPLIERKDADGQWQTAITQETQPQLVLADFESEYLDSNQSVLLTTGAAEDIIFEERGPRRCVIHYRVPYLDQQYVTHLQSTVRLFFYADQPSIKMVHRLEVVSPALTPAAGGALDAPHRQFGVMGRSIRDDERETGTILTLRSFQWRFGRAATTAVQLDGVDYSLDKEASWRLVHEHDLAHRIDQASGTAMQMEQIEGRTDGHLISSSPDGPLAIAIRNFWESYPRGIQIDPDAVTVELFPSLTDEPFPGDENAWHRLNFWREDGAYRLKAGMALTSEVLLAFPEDDDHTKQLFAWFEQPPVVRPDFDCFMATKVWDPVAPKTNSPFPQYEKMMEVECDEWLEDRARLRQYGFINFGDWYGESYWSWGNNEYDPAFCHYIEFIRGGDPRWAMLGAQATRHLVDVDTCNHSTNPNQIGAQYMHMPGHAGGYLPPYFRSKMAGSTTIPSHAWVEGPILHYLLTGDESTRESIERTGHWLSDNRLDTFDFMNARECGWHITHLCALARMTDDPRYLNACRIIIERVLEKQNEHGGWVHMLKEGHCDCGIPRCIGEATFMVGVLLAGLRRFHALTGDERVAQSILAAVDWLFANNLNEETGHFRYTTCPKRGALDEGNVHTISALEGLSYANQLRPDPRIAKFLRQGIEELGTPRLARDQPNNSGFGKELCMEMRRAPMLVI
ncbi:hypothetical protein KFU94_57895 [Chloroflexi bacterium TSY]|nr:hypothetical protein [Chloroflexi bacterium TSY]